jgi:integrase
MFSDFGARFAWTRPSLVVWKGVVRLQCACENRHGPGAESPAGLCPIRGGRAAGCSHGQGARLKPAATTKQRRLRRAPISASVVALLRTIRLRVPEECEWVFPGDAEGKPLQDIKQFWEDVRAKADLPAVRIHDLRHTFASLLVSGGMTLPMIGKLLGHT